MKNFGPYLFLSCLLLVAGATSRIRHHDLDGLYRDDHPQYLRKDSTRPLDADWDFGLHTISGLGLEVTDIDFSGQLTSTVAEGTAPFVITSTTLNTNLNADLLDGSHASAFAGADAGLASLAGLTYVSPSFVKLTGADTFSLDTNTYYKSGDSPTFTNITDSGLTSGRVTYASTDGLLADDSDLTYASDILNFKFCNVPITAATAGTPTAGVFYQNSARLIHSYGTGNLFLGSDAGNFTLTGNLNVAVGAAALDALTSGYNNVGIGGGALGKVTTGYHNFGLGADAGRDLLGGDSNVLIGSQAGLQITSGLSNVFIGRDSGAVGGTGIGQNTGVGRDTLRSCSGSNNTCIGFYAGRGSTSANNNVYIGYAAGWKETTEDNQLMISGVDHGSAAAEKTGSIIYGIMTTTTANQTLALNAAVSIPYTLGVTGLTTLTGGVATPKGAITLAAGATAIAATKSFHVITGDGGGNTVATITGGADGMVLRLLFVDALVTITDTDAHTANTVDLSAAFTSADDTVLTLIFDGTSWYETSRSVN
jgi:hypothetical protein